VEGLRNNSGFVRAGKRRQAVRLGEAVTELMERSVTPGYRRFVLLQQAWVELVPAAIAEHTRLADYSGGLLTVSVDSPAYMYELQLCRAELLQALRGHCGRLKPNRIRFVVDG